MLKIRLQRVGRKHEPVFRVVLTERTNSTKSGKFSEILGSYDPRHNTVSLKPERIKHWMSVGAEPTPTMHNLLISEKVILGKKINVLPKKTPPVVAAKEEASPLTPEVQEKIISDTPPADISTESESPTEEALAGEPSISPEEAAQEAAEETEEK